MNAHPLHAALPLTQVCRSTNVALLCASLFLTGCTTMHRVALPTSASSTSAIHVGDHVQVLTKAGQTLSFTVSQIEPAALVGENVRVAFSNIADLHVRRADHGKTARFATAAVLLTGLVILISYAAKFGPGLPSFAP